jgi:hypothetical protein
MNEIEQRAVLHPESSEVDFETNPLVLDNLLPYILLRYFIGTEP